MNWNQKAWQIAGNGNDGFVPLITALARGLQGSPVGPSLPPDFSVSTSLRGGYATFGDDRAQRAGIPWQQRLTGAPLPPAGSETHLPGPLGPDPNAWVRNDEAFRNYGYEHVKKGHDVAMAIFMEMYGVKPKITYFGGESQGGRSARTLPPGMLRITMESSLAEPILYLAAHDLGRVLRAKMQSAPGAYIPYSKQRTIRMEIVRLCDNLDGLEDGVINNYIGCNRMLDAKLNPDPLKNIRCPGGADTGDTCLSDAQMAVINAFHSPIEIGFPLADDLTYTAPVETSQEDPGGMGLGVRWQRDT